MDYNEIFRNRTKSLALRTITAMSPLKYSDEVSVIRKQLIRSVTSVAANYRASNRARSDRERYAKICIVVEESDETLFWLELVDELNLLPKETLKPLMDEANEIVKTMAAYRKSLKS